MGIKQTALLQGRARGVVNWGGSGRLIGLDSIVERSWGDHWSRPGGRPAFFGIGSCHDSGSVRTSRPSPSNERVELVFHPGPTPLKLVGHWARSADRSLPRSATAGLASEPGGASGHPHPPAAARSSVH